MESELRSNGQVRLVSAPVEHQGVRDALRVSFDCGKDVPAEFERLLNRIR